ncbi:GSCFA domain-containing protein [Pseudaestuariivita atlantica]|uniref:GSCFA family protein n=1 Tax=Pseudaestuariivita atlantica TaxID=1317121 RepID=A0A0L1JNN9_9RHOB|nr:GSCFA domain-containing protein [Pseudaestuariivita atlantica]KNG93371.1 GSCFA family protein [Pseudaestuariivita atlantica]
MANPYESLPDDAFWRTGVAARDPLDPGNLYQPKFAIEPKKRIATAGSCFAQHVGRALKSADVKMLDVEPAPRVADPAIAARFGYGLFSARYGNIYTARQLLQLAQEAYGEFTPANAIWERDGRYFDALRPGVEPEGLGSPEEVMAHRAKHLEAVRLLFKRCDVFVFTFGLTETWCHEESGTVYPMAPGVIAGDWNPDETVFRNLTYEDVMRDFCAFRRLLDSVRPRRYVVTVSPVPLTATASGKHVEVATTHSKAILRAVCGQLAERFRNVDYFPSYEIITSINARGAYYAENARSVTTRGVETAMTLFLNAHGLAPVAPASGTDLSEDEKLERAFEEADDLFCDEALLEKFR